jgi:hypothetical protein
MSDRNVKIERLDECTGLLSNTEEPVSEASEHVTRGNQVLTLVVCWEYAMVETVHSDSKNGINLPNPSQNSGTNGVHFVMGFWRLD